MHGEDVRGREVLGFAPGTVVDVDTEMLTDRRLADLARWARDLHTAVGDREDAGPWRFLEVGEPTLVAHNDLAPYDVCFEGERLSGVLDWDLSGPSTPVNELAHLAWTGVPLFRPVPAASAARRLGVMAAAYGGLSGRELLDAVPGRTPARHRRDPRGGRAGRRADAAPLR